jgi:hypothetical protein
MKDYKEIMIMNNLILYETVKFQRTENSISEDGVLIFSDKGQFIEPMDTAKGIISTNDVYDYQAKWYFE